MTAISVDGEKVRRMVRDTLMQFNGSSVHPAEMVLALGEAMGRVIAQVDGTDVAKRELLDLGIKHIAKTIQCANERIIEG